MTPYARGHAAGHAEAVEREHRGDAHSATDATTWLAMPAGEPDAAEYERGWNDGWTEYFTAR